MSEAICFSVPVHWINRHEDSWLARNYRANAVEVYWHPLASKIETLAARTDDLGYRPLWNGYPPSSFTQGATRRSAQVRADRILGNFYASLAELRQPPVVVEIGTAFGVSGMYWLAGLGVNPAGHLFTFEPNLEWAAIARRNLAEISNRFTLVNGIFEDHVVSSLKAGDDIDIALIDAIHASEYVLPQLDLVIENAAPGCIIILDDISFSGDMQSCWHRVATDQRFVASMEFGGRIGIVELGK
jgi:predicted O-methyltransferase YrrM